jgi:hypothetical protein
MFQFLLGFFGRHQRLSTTARNLVTYFKQTLDDDPDLLLYFVKENHDDELSTWAQSFCNIDTNGNLIIDKKELQDYIQKHYRSPYFWMWIRNKKEKPEVLAAAMEQFKSAAQEKGDVSDDACALTFKHFVRMMVKLKQVPKDSNVDACKFSCKFFEFLKNATGTSSRRDHSDKSAKIIEKSAGGFHASCVYCHFFPARILLDAYDHNFTFSHATQNGEMASTSMSQHIWKNSQRMLTAANLTKMTSSVSS